MQNIFLSNPRESTSHHLITFRILIFGLGIFFLTVFPVLADQLSIEASIDRDTIALDDFLSYTITISGSGANNVPAPSTPVLKNLTVVSQSQSSSISIINAKMSVVKGFVYTLKPEKDGQASIGAARLSFRGTDYQTQPISITVTKAAGGQRTRGSRVTTPFGVFDELFEQDSSVSQDREVSNPIRLTTKISKNVVYVNEPVILTLIFYWRVSLLESPIISPPTTVGFWSIELPEIKNTRQETINGISYLARDVKIALFPTQPGDITIGKASVAARVSNFSPEMQLETKPILVKVLPLPEKGKPKNFKGAVGKYSLSADMDKGAIEQGKPFALRVKIVGDGNVKAVSEPEVSFDNKVKKLSVNANENIIKGYNSVSGSKTFEYILMPIGKGKSRVGPIRFSYFNPSTGKYVEISSDFYDIKILPSNIPLPKGIEQTTGSQEKPIIHVSRQMIVNALLVISVIALLVLAIVGIIWGITRYRKYLYSDPIKVKRKRAKQVAMNNLKKAKNLLKAGKLKEFVAEAYDAVAHYLGDRYNFAAMGMTHDQLKDILSQMGIINDVQQEIDRFIFECDIIRFTPSSLDRSQAEEILRIAEGLIVAVGKGITSP
ncbi:MAG: BatD family protein [Candidatus Desantisbacteria bacterium]